MSFLSEIAEELMKDKRLVFELEDVLRQAKEKLELYRQSHSGEYVGGTEFSVLMRRIDAVLSQVHAAAGEPT